MFFGKNVKENFMQNLDDKLFNQIIYIKKQKVTGIFVTF